MGAELEERAAVGEVANDMTKMMIFDKAGVLSIAGGMGKMHGMVPGMVLTPGMCSLLLRN